MATSLSVVERGATPGPPDDGPGHQAGAIRAAVLAALGSPPRLYRVAVVPLWGDRFRVNVFTGDGPDSAHIPHSYFLAADGRGNILESTPAIRKEY